MNIKVERIINKLWDSYKDKIYKDDIEGFNDKCDKYISRSLSALSLVMACSISINDSANCIVDGGNDGGIDAIYIDREKKIIAFSQAKLHKNGTKGFSTADVLKFHEGITNLFNDEYSEFNTRIKNMRPQINEALLKEDYSIKFVYIYTGVKFEGNSTILKKISKFSKKMSGGSDLVTDEILDLDTIYEFVVTNNYSEKINIEQLEIINPNINEHSQKAVYGLVKASDISKFYKQFGNRLLNSNIRYYKQDSSVNEGMKKVVREEGRNFHLYNNGIKAICSRIQKLKLQSTSREVNYFNCTDFSIVNGAQTSGVLGSFTEEELQDVLVFITIISLENCTPEDGEQIDLGKKITTLSNTQNKIEFSDFATLDERHEKLSCKLNLDDKYYVFKTGDTIQYPEKSFTLRDLTIALSSKISVEMGAKIKNGYGNVFKNTEGKTYNTIFEDLTPFNAWNSTTIYKITEVLCNDFAKEKTGILYAIPTYGQRFMMYLVTKELESLYPNLYEKYFENTDENIKKIKEIVDKYIPIIKSIVETNYSSDVLSNVFRNSKKCNFILNKIKEKVEQKI